MTLLGLQVVILLLVMSYYFIAYRPDIMQDTPHLDERWSPFTSAEQSLYAFEIVWAIGFAWVVMFKRPPSLFTVFLRRCPLEQATYVSVFVPDGEDEQLVNEDIKQTLTSQIFTSISNGFDKVLKVIFSEVNHGVPGVDEFVPVLNDDGLYIEFRLRRYHFDENKKCFEPSALHIGGSGPQLYAMRTGLATSQIREKVSHIGYNVIKIEEPSFFRILLREFSRTFYVYQNFMTWTWLNFSYWHMGIVNTLVYTTGGLVVSLVQYQNDVRLQELSKISGTVEVLRDGAYVTIEQKDIVPGDVVSIASGVSYCDMVVLQGEALVDESSLTGESMPIVKTSFDNTSTSIYDSHHHKHHSIFAGTTVLLDSDDKTDQPRPLALVIKTGSYTMKGELLRDILYGKPHKFKFDVEVNFVLLILLSYAIFGFSMTIYFLNSDALYGFFYAIYVVAATIPPLLPTVFIVAEGIAAERLYSKGVVVSDSHRILMAGKVRVAFFDKTGTLTEQGLDFVSVVPLVDNRFGEPAQEPTGLLARGMSVCHSVKKVSRNGVETFIGNAIDRKMFESSGYVLESGRGITPDSVTNSDKKHKFSILKQFDFDTRLKTQSVIMRDDGDNSLWVFTKGTGEALKKICHPKSIPSNFDLNLAESAKSGLYQISMGCKSVELNVMDKSREEVESDLNFIGFLNFSNKMKLETPSVVRQLREGNIRSVMISGDHVLTAIYMARLSGMVHVDSRIILGKSVSSSGVIQWVDEETDIPVTLPSIDALKAKDSDVELALSGPVWEYLVTHQPNQAKELAHFVRVIGRCSPNDKITMVDTFNKQGFITMMCGDGGNDCGALRTAHVGVALSDAEASVVSPFTSIRKDITSVIDVLKEGRCTLASAISSYKYMIMYGQVETINQIANAWFAITFSEWCWVFMVCV